MNRLPFDLQLKSHNLSEEDIAFFAATFVQCRFPYNVKLDEGSGWLMRTFYGKRAILDDYVIGGHLMGKHLVATFPGPYTKYLCLDLDYSKNLEKTLDAILRIFPESLVIQSSRSKGIHLYHFFDSRISVNKLQKLTKQRLNAHGITVHPGYCEIFPQINRALRLPMGKESYVLDEKTLIPLHQNVWEGIKFIKERIIYHSVTEILPQSKIDDELTFSAPSELAGKNLIAPIAIKDSETISNLGASDLSWGKLQGKGFKDFIDQALRSGIQMSGTRYATQSKLVWHYWSLGYSKERCYESIWGWYSSHNHRSKDWKKCPDRVLRNLRSAIECLYRNAQLKGYHPYSTHKKHLRVEDTRNIIQMTSDYRKQKFIFSLLEYALNSMNSKNQFRLPLKRILNFDCCSGRSYIEKIQFCEAIGLIQKVREYFRQQGRARTYLINYAFREDGEQVGSLEEGLKEVLDVKALKLRYSWRIVKKVTIPRQSRGLYDCWPLKGA